MARVLHRTTKQYLRSVNTPDYDPADWIINPDVTGFENVRTKYWNISGDTVTEMTPAEKDAVDAAEQAAQVAAAKAALKDQYDQAVVSDKAILITVLAMNNRLTNKINSLEAALEQLKAELKNQALNNALTYDFSTPTPNLTGSQVRDNYRTEIDGLG